MEIIIKGTPGEIAALVGAIQGRQGIDYISLSKTMLTRPDVLSATSDKGEATGPCKAD